MRQVLFFAASFFIVILAVVVLFPSGKIAPSQAIVTVSFDDASIGQYAQGLRIANEFQIRGTLFVVSGFADDASAGDTSARKGFRPMSWAQVREFLEAGWEIGAHSLTHPHLTRLDQEEATRQIRDSGARIEDQIGVRPKTFASPYGDFSDEVLALVEKWYPYHVRAWGGNEGFNPIGSSTPQILGRFSVSYQMQPEFVCEQIRRAAAEGSWLVLTFHEIVEGAPGRFQVNQGDFREMMACAREMANEGLIRIATIEEAMRPMTAKD